ncbi:MAG: hypothetical protein U1E93_14410 [Alphaproteobacteria bacterium]
MHCDHAFYAGATPQNIGALAELEQMPGVCGIKAFRIFHRHAAAFQI